MEHSFFQSMVWQLVKQMDWIAIFILLGLFFTSVICVAIVSAKIMAFRQYRGQCNLLVQRLRSARHLNDVVALAREFRGGIASEFLGQVLDRLKIILEKADGGKGEPVVLSEYTMQHVEESINQVIDTMILEQEAYLPVLSVCAAAAPLVGLFGTIWGLIHAFIDISQEKSADIATVAPGMAEALIITLAGLLVAIPALIAFHYFSNEVRKMEMQLTHAGSICIMLVKDGFAK